MADRPSRLDLARLASGDLTDEEARVIRAQLEGSPADQQRWGELQANVAAYEQSAPRDLAVLRQRMEQETRRATPPWRRAALLLLPAAVAGAAALLLLLHRPALPPPGEEEIGFKGTLAIRVVARRGAHQFTVRPGDSLAAGDALRFMVTVPSAGHLTVFSIDGRARLSPYYPESDPSSDPTPLRLDRAGQHVLPGSIVLDDAPGPERFFIVFSAKSFDRAQVHQRARRLDAAATSVSPRELGLEGGALELIRVGKSSGAGR